MNKQATAKHLGKQSKTLKLRRISQETVFNETGISLTSFSGKLSGGVFNIEELNLVSNKLDVRASQLFSLAERMQEGNSFDSYPNVMEIFGKQVNVKQAA